MQQRYNDTMNVSVTAFRLAGCDPGNFKFQRSIEKVRLGFTEGRGWGEPGFLFSSTRITKLEYRSTRLSPSENGRKCSSSCKYARYTSKDAKESVWSTCFQVRQYCLLVTEIKKIHMYDVTVEVSTVGTAQQVKT